jgi:phosphomannomutase
VVSTDANYFAIARHGAGGGIQVTASHNPAQYNGFKISREQATPLSADTGLTHIKRIAMGPPVRPAQERGHVTTRDVLPDFAEHVLSFAWPIEPLRVAIDAGNGMAGRMLPPILDRLPIQATRLYFDLDGSFPNHEPNPLKKENLRDVRRAVVQGNCHLGVAFDGDADRCVFVDEKGEPVSSDLVTALIAGHLLQRNKGAAILYDLRSSWVVAEEIRRNGGVPVIERVGHSFMKAAMREKDAVFGGELSGHFYFRDHYYADSGVIAFIETLNVLSARRQPFSELLKPLRRYFATGEINFEVADKDEKMRRLKEIFADGKIGLLDGVTVEYEDWWFNARPSNTEPLLRLNLEATSRELMERGLKKVREVIEG